MDEDAAAIVRRIFQLSLNGYGVEQIADKLSKSLVLTPIYYWKSKGVKRPGRTSEHEPHRWNSTTVIKILTTQEYCGDIINFKTYTKSYKNKKKHINDEENQVVFKGVNKAIIRREDFELVQRRRGKVRKYQLKDEEQNIFSGLLICADCGHNLHYHFNQGNPDIKYFNCSNYKGNRGTCPSTHYVRIDFLERVVLGEIRRLTWFASKHETDFLAAMAGFSLDAVADAMKHKRRELDALKTRDEELDVLFERLYEDNVSGKLPDHRFVELSADYEAEQADLESKLEQWQADLDEQAQRAEGVDRFIEKCKEHEGLEELTATVLNDLIHKVFVSAPDKTSGKRKQSIFVSYDFVGILPELSIPEVNQNERPA